jgi:hypothetical protein
LIACPVPGKRKSAELCQAFIDGAGAAGRASDAAVFYGVTDANRADWDAVRAAGRDWYYIDNSYFDVSRGSHFRVTRNRMQHNGRGHSNGNRFAALGVPIAPWQSAGRHLVLCPQSDEFMRLAGFRGNWLEDTLALLHGVGKQGVVDRPIVSRGWQSDKKALAATLADDLRDAWALVTWSSAAAVTAVLAGVPVFVGSPDCAAWEMSGRGLFNSPERAFPSADERLLWASVLADNQWTVDEMRSGFAWNMLNA